MISVWSTMMEISFPAMSAAIILCGFPKRSILRSGNSPSIITIIQTPRITITICTILTRACILRRSVPQVACWTLLLPDSIWRADGTENIIPPFWHIKSASQCYYSCLIIKNLNILKISNKTYFDIILHCFSFYSWQVQIE